MKDFRIRIKKYISFQCVLFIIIGLVLLTIDRELRYFLSNESYSIAFKTFKLGEFYIPLIYTLTLHIYLMKSNEKARLHRVVYNLGIYFAIIAFLTLITYYGTSLDGIAQLLDLRTCPPRSFDCMPLPAFSHFDDYLWYVLSLSLFFGTFILLSISKSKDKRLKAMLTGYMFLVVIFLNILIRYSYVVDKFLTYLRISLLDDARNIVGSHTPGNLDFLLYSIPFIMSLFITLMIRTLIRQKDNSIRIVVVALTMAIIIPSTFYCSILIKSLQSRSDSISEFNKNIRKFENIKENTISLEAHITVCLIDGEIIYNSSEIDKVNTEKIDIDIRSLFSKLEYSYISYWGGEQLEFSKGTTSYYYGGSAATVFPYYTPSIVFVKNAPDNNTYRYYENIKGNWYFRMEYPKLTRF